MYHQKQMRPKTSGNATVLREIRLTHARDAYEAFGKRSATTGREAGSVPMRATVTGGCFECCFPWFTIPDGFYATVASFGKQLNYVQEDGSETPIWPTGCHMKKYCCFSGVRELVTKQTLVFDTPVEKVYTKDDIQVDIDVCLQLRVMCDKDMNEDPNNMLKFVETLGVNSLMSQLKDAQAETVRRMARKQTHMTVYGLRAMKVDGTMAEIDLDHLNDDAYGREAGTITQLSITEMAEAVPNVPDMDRSAGSKTVQMTGMSKDDDAPISSGDVPLAMDEAAKGSSQDKYTDIMLKTLNKQFNAYGIEITDLQIQDVRLPLDTQATVEAKTTIATSRALEVMQQKHKIQQIEYSNQKLLKQQEFENEGEKIDERGKRQVAEINNALTRERAHTVKIIRDTQEKSKSSVAQIKANNGKNVAVLNADTSKILALPMYTPDRATAIMCGGEHLEGKKIVAENAAQLIADYTRGEVQKNLALGQLEVAKINNETDKVVAELDASTATVTELPHFKVDKICAEKCGRPDWAGKEILAVNVARMFVEHSRAEVNAMSAKAELEVAQAQSDSNKDVYAAEGKAAKCLRDRRAFELAKRQIDVYRSMVGNDKVSFMGSDESSMLPNMVTVHNNVDSDAPWDAIRQLTDALTQRISEGGQRTLEGVMSKSLPPPRR